MHRFWKWLAYTFFLHPLAKVIRRSIEAVTYVLRRAGRANEKYSVYLNSTFSDLSNDPRKMTRTDLTIGYMRSLGARAMGLPYHPKVSILLPVHKVRPEIFAETLRSVAWQSYPNWELCVVDDASGDQRLTEMIQAFATKHQGQVKSAANATNAHISATSNRCLELATGDYVALLDHDDRLLPHALAEMVLYINQHERPDILYSDERIIDEAGKFIDGPFFKPAWSPLLHLSVNYTAHLSVYSRELLKRIGGFRQGFEGAQDHDLMMRAVEASKKPVVHVPFVLYQWRAMSGSTASSIDEKPYAVKNGIKAVTEACERRHTPADVDWEPAVGHYRVKFRLPNSAPLVSIIIPSKDAPELLKRCLDSIADKTTYKNFEIVISDNGTTNQQTLQLYADYTKRLAGRFQVLTKVRPFNFGAQINDGVNAARGDYVLLLNNDTEVRTPEWIEEHLRLAQLPQAGAVGCKLLYPNGTIQHAGVLLITRNIACHALRYLPENTNYYINMGNTVHEAMAVTAACLMVAKKKFLEVGGFDELYLPNGFGDIDLCLKLRKAGYASIYTPYAVLTHHESLTRGLAVESFEKMTMLERWPAELMSDPYLNFNLNRHEHYQRGFEFDLDITPDVLSRM